MSKIRIKNFGPIKEGYTEGDGFMDIKKVTVFIGNQGSGKSTVAKLISTFKWMEKAINRGDISLFHFHKYAIQNYLAYHRIKNYFGDNTLIEYVGEYVSIKYSNENNPPEVEFRKDEKYRVPKIMYVPSERNFLSAIENVNNIKRLPGSLFTFAEELRNGQNEFKDKEISLPVSDVIYRYEEENDSSYLIGKDYKVNLLEASSGYQSLVPLFLVSKFLTDELSKGGKILREQLSVEQSIRRNEEIARIMLDEQLSDEEKSKKVAEIDARYLNVCFINIVEEPEQNLYPDSQQHILYSLLEFVNLNEGNKLIMTTHSPYIINYLTLAIKADSLKKQLKTDKQKTKLNGVVPLISTVNSNDLVIYELDEKDGTIKKLGDYKGLPSDENYLNEKLGESNELFAQLLEIEQSL